MAYTEKYTKKSLILTALKSTEIRVRYFVKCYRHIILSDKCWQSLPAGVQNL